MITLQQLKCLREISRQSLSISAAAEALNASQPGVTRQVQGLERALGVQLLLRSKNRLLGFTDAGLTILELATRVMGDVDTMQAVAADARAERSGKLRVATTHLHARYTLRAAIKRFSAEHRHVEFQLLQVDADRIASLVERGEAELGVSTDAPGESAALLFLEGEAIRRSLVFPRGHPLAARKRLSLEDLARYPFLGYSPHSRNGRVIAQAFEARGIAVRYVVSAADSDVIKTYVEEGLGVAVVPSAALEGSDHELGALDVTDLFPGSRMVISLRRAGYARRYVTDFIELLAPQWSRLGVLEALKRVRM